MKPSDPRVNRNCPFPEHYKLSMGNLHIQDVWHIIQHIINEQGERQAADAYLTIRHHKPKAVRIPLYMGHMHDYLLSLRGIHLEKPSPFHGECGVRCTPISPEQVDDYVAALLNSLPRGYGNGLTPISYAGTARTCTTP